MEKLICLGGSFNITPYIDNYYDDNCYFNNPPDYMPNLTDEWFIDKIKAMKIIIGVGEWDIYLQENYRMSDILNSKNIEHYLDVRSYATHDWKWWKEMFPQYLSRLLTT